MENADYSDIRLGQYADFLRYDPDGIAGPPTPQNSELEDQLFGKQLMQAFREFKESE